MSILLPTGKSIDRNPTGKALPREPATASAASTHPENRERPHRAPCVVCTHHLVLGCLVASLLGTQESSRQEILLPANGSRQEIAATFSAKNIRNKLPANFRAGQIINIRSTDSRRRHEDMRKSLPPIRPHSPAKSRQEKSVDYDPCCGKSRCDCRCLPSQKVARNRRPEEGLLRGKCGPQLLPLTLTLAMLGILCFLVPAT